MKILLMDIESVWNKRKEQPYFFRKTQSKTISSSKINL